MNHGGHRGTQGFSPLCTPVPPVVIDLEKLERTRASSRRIFMRRAAVGVNVGHELLG